MKKFFLTRDWDATLKLHFEEPTLFQEDIWISLGEKELDFTLFPEVTFENSPMQVELKLVEK